MSKVDITGRSNHDDRLMLRMQRYPGSTDPGKFQPQAGRTFHSINFSGLEMRLAAEYAVQFLGVVTR